MWIYYKQFIVLISFCGLIASCKTLETASLHGLTSGHYSLRSENKSLQDVYLDVHDDQIEVYQSKKRKIDTNPIFTFSPSTADSLSFTHLMFKKQSLDIDITSIILKYRPSVQGLPAQLNTDLNVALYVGWRNDNYHIIGKQDPLGRKHHKIGNLGYDLGFFAGPGAAIINPFTTNDRRVNDYSGMMIQYGIAGFLESNVASFGLSIGYDHLLNPDRKIWIYRNKLWVGFIVGVALN